MPIQSTIYMDATSRVLQDDYRAPGEFNCEIRVVQGSAIFSQADIGGQGVLERTAIRDHAQLRGYYMLRGVSMNDCTRVASADSWSTTDVHNAVLGGHMIIDRTEGYLTMGPVGSEDRTVTAAWDYMRGEITVRAGCFYGSLDELEKRITARRRPLEWQEVSPNRGEVARWKHQYLAFISAASVIPQPDWDQIEPCQHCEGGDSK